MFPEQPIGNEEISIHALREEGDLDFYYPVFANLGISIHALREEGDVTQHTSAAWPTYFYPRPPRGGRLMVIRVPPKYSDFYPRPPRGGRRRSHRGS